MLRSLYSAVSGVKGHQTYLDVTGNNIANVNTVGFKRDSVLFADQIYQTQKSASAPNSAVPIGGINPAQVGLGVQVAAIETIHSQGSSQNTGQETDMMINGKGFFVTEMGGQRYYTRSGAFSLDRDYNLVQQGTGYMVQGYAYKNQIDPATGRITRVKDTELSNVRIPIGEKIPAKPTELVNFRCNLCQTVKAEVEDYESIPGGTATVPRPHEYTAYGSAASMTNISANADPQNGVNPGTNGDTWFNINGGDGKLFIYSQSGGGWIPQETFDTNIYYGANPAAGADNIAQKFYTGDGGALSGGNVLRRATVDYAGDGTDLVIGTGGLIDPASTPPKTVKAGATYLDTGTGLIHTANATGTAWLTPGTADVAQAGYAYAVKTGGQAGADTIWAFDSGTTPKLIDVSGDSIYIFDQDKNNIFYWDTSIDGQHQWANWNLINGGIKANGYADGIVYDRGADSATTQATIDKFQDSIIANNDHTIKLTVYDSLGTPRTLEVFFRKVISSPSYPNGLPNGQPNGGDSTPVAAETEWDWYAAFLNEDGTVATSFGEGAGTLVFGDDGLLKRTYYYDPTPATPDPAATPTSEPVYNWELKEFVVGRDEGQPTGVMIADFGVAGAEGKVDESTVPTSYASNKITLDFLGYDYSQMLGSPFDATGIDGVTSFASPTTTNARYQDGYAMGVLNNFSVGADGTVTGQYSNGQNLPVAQVAVAMFANDAGLTKVGGTYFQESANSGMAQISGGMSNGAGSIMSNNLEMSNVDLSEEFVNLIKAQRGLQANSRVVTTSDQVLEELINLKR